MRCNEAGNIYGYGIQLRFVPWLAVDVKISDDEKYIVLGTFEIVLCGHYNSGFPF